MKNQTVTMQWIDVDGVENMPIGVYFVCMRDINGLQEYGVCEVVMAGQGKYAHKVGVINGQFYFEFPYLISFESINIHFMVGLVFFINVLYTKCRFVNRNILPRLFKRIGILHTRILSYFY